MSETYDDYNSRITNWVQEVQAVTRLPVEHPINQVSENNSTVISNDVRGIISILTYSFALNICNLLIYHHCILL